MLFHIPNILSAAEAAEQRVALDDAQWIDGRATAGAQAAAAKANQQLPDDHPTARRLGAAIVAALTHNAMFVAAALPLKLSPPRFNRYGGGENYGNHVDAPICGAAGMPVRSDLSATLFLSAPEDYDGGELVIETDHGARKIKLPAGHLVLYPATSIHSILPVTDGVRLAAFFWVQSMVREDQRRRLLFDLEIATRELTQALPALPPEAPGRAAMARLASVHANLVRLWAET